MHVAVVRLRCGVQDGVRTDVRYGLTSFTPSCFTLAWRIFASIQDCVCVQSCGIQTGTTKLHNTLKLLAGLTQYGVCILVVFLLVSEIAKGFRLMTCRIHNPPVCTPNAQDVACSSLLAWVSCAYFTSGSPPATPPAAGFRLSAGFPLGKVMGFSRPSGFATVIKRRVRLRTDPSSSIVSCRWRSWRVFSEGDEQVHQAMATKLQSCCRLQRFDSAAERRFVLWHVYLDARGRGRECQAVEQVLVGVVVGERNRRRRNAFLERQEPEREVLGGERRHLSWSRTPQGQNRKRRTQQLER